MVLEKYADFLQKKNVKQKDLGIAPVMNNIRSINNHPFSHDIPKISHFLMGFQGFHLHHPTFLKTAGGRAPAQHGLGAIPALRRLSIDGGLRFMVENDECMMVYVSFMFNLWWICIIYGEYVSFMVNDGCMNMYNLWFKMMVVFCCINNICTYIYIYMYVCIFVHWLIMING